MIRKSGSDRDIRRMMGLELAAKIVGGQAKLAAALGIDARMLRAKMTAERPIHDDELACAAAAVRAAALAAEQLADRIDALVAGDAA